MERLDFIPTALTSMRSTVESPGDLRAVRLSCVVIIVALFDLHRILQDRFFAFFLFPLGLSEMHLPPGRDKDVPPRRREKKLVR